jgi:hypothetical protein
MSTDWYVVAQYNGGRYVEGPLPWREAQKKRTEFKKDNAIYRIGIEDASGMRLHEWIRGPYQ